MSSAAGGQAVPAASLGPPYPPSTAALGGAPTPTPDIAICGTFIGLFGLGAIGHMFIFRRNRAAGHHFVFSALVFGFCMARIVALVLRITWAQNLTNTNLGIAATVLTSAGVLLLFVVNLLLSRRVVRALHPAFGWSRGVKYAFAVLIATLVAVLVMVVVGSVVQLFTLDDTARQRCRDVVMVASVYMAVIAFLPAVWMVLVRALRSRSHLPAENFGVGSMGTKMALLAFTSTLLTLGAGFRAAVAIEQTPIDQPQWYHSKPAFYCFIFAIEIIVVYTYLIYRFDQRFHVPDGSSAPGHYSGLGRGGDYEMGNGRDNSRDSARGMPAYKNQGDGQGYQSNYGSA